MTSTIAEEESLAYPSVLGQDAKLGRVGVNLSLVLRVEPYILITKSI